MKTTHSLRVWQCWLPRVSTALATSLEKALRRSEGELIWTQRTSECSKSYTAMVIYGPVRPSPPFFHILYVLVSVPVYVGIRTTNLRLEVTPKEAHHQKPLPLNFTRQSWFSARDQRMRQHRCNGVFACKRSNKVRKSREQLTTVARGLYHACSHHKRAMCERT